MPSAFKGSTELTNPFTTMIQDIQIGSCTQVINEHPSQKPAKTRISVRKHSAKKAVQEGSGSTAAISASDQMALLKLFGGVASSHDTLSEKKRCTLNKVNKLIEADAWFWCRIDGYKLVEGSEATNYVDGKNLSQYIQVMLKSHIFQIFLAQEVGNQRTMIINDGGPFSCIYSIRKMDDGNTSLFVSFRTESNVEFTERDSLILNTTLDCLPLVHEYVHDAKKLALTPKMQKVLKSLKEGHSRKQIAHHLEISVNTVSAYVRDIYREYDVHSHAELIKYFHDRD